MQGRGHRGLTPGLVGLIALIALLPSAPGVARAVKEVDLLHCEEAAAHVQDCCGTLGKLQCQYAPSLDGCAYQEGVDPSFSRAEADCILEATCGKLRAQGICEAIRSDEPLDMATLAGVCR